MTTPLDFFVVRIFSTKSNQVVGAGFLVSQKYILTCAHVIADALAIPRKTSEIPDVEISLDFPMLAAKQFFKARVVFWQPVNPEQFAEDIAGLELDNSPPQTAKPATLITSEDWWGNPFQVLGFPAKQSNGVWAYGELRDGIGNGWVQIEDVKQAGYRLEPGFSGAPIWDKKLEGVVGMAVAADLNRPETKAGFMIPVKVLCEAWSELSEQAIPQPVPQPELPEGQVALDSAFYVERPPIESDCYKQILKPGALIHVKAPRQMGKTSLMARILAYGAAQGYQEVTVSFDRATREQFADLDQFLKWFCVTVGRKLRLPEKLDDYWYEFCSSKENCIAYFEEYLLAEINQPVILGLDKVDLIFPHQAIANDFFSLLRSCHESAKHQKIWQKLRLVMVRSKEVDIRIDINQSPFNVGLVIKLPELDPAQVQNLVKRHGLNWNSDQVQKLMVMVGGHPYLVRMALYEIALGRKTLEQILQNAPTEEGLYSDHLLNHLFNLEKNQELLKAMKQVVAANSPVRIDPTEDLELQSMGLVKKRGFDVLPLCDLYRQYFRERLRVN